MHWQSEDNLSESFLLPLCSQGSNSDLQVLVQVLLPTEISPWPREHNLNDLNYFYLLTSEYALTVNFPYTLEKEVYSPGCLLVYGAFSKIHLGQADCWGRLGFLYFC